MKNALENILSEYDNTTQLLGIDPALSDSFLKYCTTMNPVHKAMVLSRINAGKHYSREHRTLFEEHFHKVPKHIKEGLMKGELCLSDHTIYAIKQVKEKIIQIFEKDDEIITGICNIQGAELPKNMVMLACSLHIMVGTSASEDVEDISSSSYDSIRKYPSLLSGEYHIAIGDRSVANRNNPLRKLICQRTGQKSDMCFELHNPFLIPNEKPITFEIMLGSTKRLEPLTFLWVGLEGVCTAENKSIQ